MKRDSSGYDPTPHRSSKDRNRWCKGRVGVGHAYRWQELLPGYWIRWSLPGQVASQLRCDGCGRVEDTVQPQVWNLGGVVHRYHGPGFEGWPDFDHQDLLLQVKP